MSFKIFRGGFEPITPLEKGSIPRVFIRYMYKAMTSMT